MEDILQNICYTDIAEIEDKPLNSFEHAAQSANPSCPKCHGTGSYQYSTHGTPHFTICDLCCKHDLGWWLLEKHYGDDNGRLCCRAGCGKTKENV